MEDTTYHNPLKCNLFTRSLLPFSRGKASKREREREDQEHKLGSKRRFFAKTTAIAECMSDMISSNSLLLSSKSVQISEPSATKRILYARDPVS
jgi:hypothetical protein